MYDIIAIFLAIFATLVTAIGLFLVIKHYYRKKQQQKKQQEQQTQTTNQPPQPEKIQEKTW